MTEVIAMHADHRNIREKLIGLREAKISVRCVKRLRKTIVVLMTV